MKAWVDGATWKSNPGFMGAGILFEDGTEYCEALWWGSSNEAEWHALIRCLEYFITEFPDTELTIFSDSKNTVMQASAKWKIHARNLEPLGRQFFFLKKVARKMKKKVRVKWVRREENGHADRISKAAASLTAVTVGADVPPEDPEDQE